MSSSNRLKKIAGLLLPPIITKGLARLQRRSDAEPVLEYAPDGWKTRQTMNIKGWNTESVVNAERAKWAIFCSNLQGAAPLGFSHEHPDLIVRRNVSFHNIHITYAYVLALAAHHKSNLSVLDWGGGLGHYYLIGKAVLPDVALDFHCREVPVMCEHGKQLCPEVQFYADDSCLEKTYDLVMVNGSLGYFEDWEQTLTRIIRSVKDYLLLTRVLVVKENSSFVVLQRGNIYNFDSNMLTQVLNEREVLRAVEASGLRLVREFVVGAGPTVVGAPEQCVDLGWLFKRDS